MCDIAIDVGVVASGCVFGCVVGVVSCVLVVVCGVDGVCVMNCYVYDVVGYGADGC